MPEILTRAGKGSDLTPNEADANFKRTVVAKTGTYTTLSTDNRSLIECSHATVAFTVTLLAVATAAAVDTGDYEVTIFNIGAAIVSVDGNASEPINGSASVVTLHQWESATFKLNNAGTGYNTVSSAPLAKNYPRVYQAKQATTSGTTIDFTGIPSWATRIIVMLDVVSLDAADAMEVRIGDAGGFENTGYASAASAGSPVGSTTGFVLTETVSHVAEDAVFSGIVTLELYDATTFEWLETGTIKTDSKIHTSSGINALDTVLTQVQLTTVGGATFDAGSVRLSYE